MSTKWGIISTAHINRLVLAGARESDRVDVIAVASRDQARAEAYAREHGIERAYGSYEALLADPDVEAVYISLPNSLHVEWSIRALEAGKHVLCEKPLDRRPEEVERAFDAADRAGRILVGGVHVPPQPADGEAPGARRQRRDRRPAARPLGLQLQPRRAGERPPGRRPRRRGAHGRRLLLRQRLAPARRRARVRLRRAGHRRERGGRPLRRHDALPRRRRWRSSTAASSCRTATSSRSSAPRGRSSWTIPGMRARPSSSCGATTASRRSSLQPADSYRLELENLGDAIAGRAEPLLGREDARRAGADDRGALPLGR